MSLSETIRTVSSYAEDVESNIDDATGAIREVISLLDNITYEVSEIEDIQENNELYAETLRMFLVMAGMDEIFDYDSPQDIKEVLEEARNSTESVKCVRDKMQMIHVFACGVQHGRSLVSTWRYIDHLRDLLAQRESEMEEKTYVDPQNLP